MQFARVGSLFQTAQAKPPAPPSKPIVIRDGARGVVCLDRLLGAVLPACNWLYRITSREPVIRPGLEPGPTGLMVVMRGVGFLSGWYGRPASCEIAKTNPSVAPPP